MRSIVLGALAGAVGCAAAANAWEVRVRFVERVGNIDVVLVNNQIEEFYFPRRFRVQVGLFADASGPAPAGGVVGWTGGSLVLSDGRGTRTPGRLTVFTFNPDGNGMPAADPFVSLSAIDASIGPQTPVWGCDAGGAPLPIPAATVRGRNTYVSLYEFTAEPGRCGMFRATVTGDIIAASQWQTVGVPVPPVCSPPTPGQVVYAPQPLPAQPVSVTLYMIVGPPPKGWVDCPPDWDYSRGVDSQDFFGFLRSFFDGFADYNCDNATNSADFFAFLAGFFAGCPF